jgi:beta-glucuronidase
VRLTLALALAAVLAPAGVARAAGPPLPVPLTGGWELAMDRQSTGIADGRPAGGGTGWRPTTVPGVFDGRPLTRDFGGTVGWYRVTFDGPAAASGYGWSLRFESVRRVAEVWLNGVPIGRHADPYVPFELPAAGLRPGVPNTLVVRVDNRKAKEPREGWWNWGGIVRPVTLVPRGRVALADPGLVYLGDGRLRFDGVLTNRAAEPRPASVGVALRAPSGRTVRASASAGTLAPGERRRLRFTLRVPRPEPWSPERPQRYQAAIETRSGARVEQRNARRVGLRTVRVRDGLLYLNGRRIDLRGASIQEDAPGHGPALTEADMDRIVAELRALHANVTRAHYLLNDRLLDKLDAAGILVWSQAPIYHRDRLLETAAQRARALATLRATVLAARNHPAVIAHSVANELSVVPDGVAGTRAYLDRAREVVRDLDPSVPPAVDLLSYPGYPRQATYAGYRLLGINSYFGWYPGKARHRTADLADLRPYLLRMRRLYPEAAMVMTEFGAESTYDGPATTKETYAFQARFVSDTLGIVGALPFMSGAIYWTLQEFAVKPDWDGGALRKGIARDAIHNKGLVTYGGRQKPAWRVARDDFADVALYPSAGERRAPGDLPGRILLYGVPAAVLALLLLDLWCLRDIWRTTRPPEATVVALPARRAA